MKSYENVSRLYLPRRMPLIIRIDGKAFHSFTRGFKKPFDDILMASMRDTAVQLCKYIEGCKVAYTQSDEISLLLTDYDSINTEPWFRKNLIKIVSIAASVATLEFNRAYESHVKEASSDIDMRHMINVYLPRIGTALFDARAFVLPKDEVCNYFIWRQQDASRNSIQMVGQAHFSHKELQGKNCDMIQEMLYMHHGINWNDLPIPQKRGLCIIKEKYLKDDVERSRWIADENIPIFTQDRYYIDHLL